MFVYERSEGLTGLNDSLEVPEREESHLVPGFEAPLGHLGDILGGAHGETKKGPILGLVLGSVLGQKMAPKMAPKLIKKPFKNMLFLEFIFWMSWSS